MSISYQNQIQRLLDFVAYIVEGEYLPSYCRCRQVSPRTCVTCRAKALLVDEPVRFSPPDSPVEVLNPSYPRYL